MIKDYTQDYPLNSKTLKRYARVQRLRTKPPVCHQTMLTIRKAAIELGISEKELRLMLLLKQIKCVINQGKIRIRIEEIEQKRKANNANSTR